MSLRKLYARAGCARKLCTSSFDPITRCMQYFYISNDDKAYLYLILLVVECEISEEGK